MIEKWQLYWLNREYKALCESHQAEAARLAVRQTLMSEQRLTSAGSLLVISQQKAHEEDNDFELSDDYSNWLTMVNDLADIRGTQYTPEQIQDAMQYDEPSLFHREEQDIYE